jgi:hypothetical protein
MNEMPLEAPSMQAGVLRGLVLLTNLLIDIVYLRWDIGGLFCTLFWLIMSFSVQMPSRVLEGARKGIRQESEGRNVN